MYVATLWTEKCQEWSWCTCWANFLMCTRSCIFNILQSILCVALLSVDQCTQWTCTLPRVELTVNLPKLEPFRRDHHASWVVESQDTTPTMDTEDIPGHYNSYAITHNIPWHIWYNWWCSYSFGWSMSNRWIAQYKSDSIVTKIIFVCLLVVLECLPVQVQSCTFM